MSEWKKVKLGECCYIGDGAHASLKREKEGILYITAKNISNNSIDYSNVSYISKETYNKHFKEKTNAITRPQKNDILYSIIGTIGGCILLKDETLGISSSIAIFRSKGSILSEYLYYYIKSSKFQTKIESIKGGVAQGFMSLSKLGTINIEYPSDEKKQKNIVSILSRYDSLIENYQKQIKLLEESAQRLYKEWFIDLRFPGHENTKIVDGVPEGWEKKKINEFASILSGYAFKSSTFEENGYYNIVTIKNVQDGFFEGKRLNHIQELPLGMPQHCLLKTGDLLLSLTGNIGRVCMVIGKNNLLNQRVAKIESKYPAFVYCLFRSSNMFTAINNLGNGAAQQNVSPIRIGELEIIFANDEVISNFEKITSNIRKQILLLYSKINLISEARDRLLPKLMSGEIEV